MPFACGSFKAPQAACNKPPGRQTADGLKRISVFDEAVQNSLHKEAERSDTHQHKELTKGSKQCQKAELNQKEMLEGKADSAVGKGSTTDEKAQHEGSLIGRAANLEGSPMGRKAEHVGTPVGQKAVLSTGKKAKHRSSPVAKKAEHRDGSTGKRASSPVD